MDTELFDDIDKDIPQFNKKLSEGMAYHEMSLMQWMDQNGQRVVSTVNEQYINNLIIQAERSFPPSLKYLGYSHATPEEEFKIITSKKREGKCYFNISRSDVYLINLYFELNGRPLPPSPIYLNFARRNNIMSVHNAKYMVSPVIADVGFSISASGIFLMGTRFKLTFDRLSSAIFIDDRRVSEYIMWSQVYNVKDQRNSKTTLPHYLFCKYGVVETFKWFGFNPVFVNREDLKDARKDYPEEKYSVIRPTGRRINRRSTMMRPVTDVCMIIPKEHNTYEMRSLAAAFYYIADLFPEKITMEDYDNIRTWRRLLGKILFGLGESEGRIINQIDAHMASVDDYVDAMVTNWLKHGGYPGIDDVYKLFKLVIEQGPQLIVNGRENITSLYGKRYVINRYINQDIIQGITNFMFNIQKLSNPNKQLKENEVKKLLNTHLPYGLALRINRDHSEVKSASSASDCLAHKVTSVALLQTEASSSNSNGPTFTPDKALDMSISEAAGHSNQPDRDPSGRSSINFWVQTDDEMTIVQNPKFKEMMDYYQSIIKR